MRRRNSPIHIRKILQRFEELELALKRLRTDVELSLWEPDEADEEEESTCDHTVTVNPGGSGMSCVVPFKLDVEEGDTVCFHNPSNDDVKVTGLIAVSDNATLDVAAHSTGSITIKEGAQSTTYYVYRLVQGQWVVFCPPGAVPPEMIVGG